MTYDLLKQAVVEALGGAASPKAPAACPGTTGGVGVSPALAAGTAAPQSSQAEPATSPTGEGEVNQAAASLEPSPWIADIDRPAVGVPRRFGVFIMMLMVTLYAVLFSLLRMLRASNLVFGLLAMLFTGIGIGQAILFGGRYPRAASIWTGSILVPIEVSVFVIYSKDFPFVSSFPGVGIFVTLMVVFFLSIPLGAVFGYLFGTLTAGGFFVVDWYEKRQQAAKESSSK